MSFLSSLYSFFGHKQHTHTAPRRAPSQEGHTPSSLVLMSPLPTKVDETASSILDFRTPNSFVQEKSPLEPGRVKQNAPKTPPSLLLPKKQHAQQFVVQMQLRKQKRIQYSAPRPSDRVLDLTHQSKEEVVQLLTREVKGKTYTEIKLVGHHWLTDNRLQKLPELFPNLVAIDLSNCPLLTNATVTMIAANYPKLEKILFNGCSKIGNPGVASLISCKHLKEIGFAQCSSVTNRPLILLAKACEKNLVVISLRECSDVSDEAISLFAFYCPNLRCVDVRGCNVTELAEENLRKRCPKLEVLHTTIRLDRNHP